MNQATYLTDFSKRLKTVTAHNCQLKKMPWCFSTDIGQFCKNYFIFEKPLKEGTSFSWLNVTAKCRKKTETTINRKVNHCEKTEKRNINKTRKPTHQPTRCFLFFAHHTFFKTIADPHCTHCQSPTSQRCNQSFVKECNLSDTLLKLLLCFI